MERATSPAHNFLSGIVTFVVVTVISVLVWVYAESRTIRVSSVDVNVMIVPKGDPNFQVTPDAAQHVRLTLKASGSGAAVVEQRALKGPVIIQLAGPDRELNSTTQQIVPLRDDIELALSLNDLGVTLLDIQPKSLDVTLTPIDSVRRPVKFLDPYNLAESGVLLRPNEVEVRAPSPAKRLLASCEPEVKLTPDQIQNVEPGKAVEIDLPVDVPGSWGGRGFQIRPASIRATVVITRRVETLTIQSIPIVIQLRPEDAGRYRVTMESGNNSFKAVRLTGPVELIERVRRTPESLTAVVRLTPELLSQAVDGRLAVEPVMMGLPQGLGVGGVERVWVRVEQIAPK